MAASERSDRDGWRSCAPGGVPALHRRRAARGPVPRHFVGLSLCDDRRDADHPPQAGRHRQVDDHRLHARLPRLQLQIPVGVDHRRRPAAGPRPARPARVVDAGDRRAGHRRRRQSRARRSRRRASARWSPPRSWSACRGQLRHRHRRLPDRNPRAAPARRRLGHVAIWLADRLGRRGRDRARRRRALRLEPPISPARRSRCRRC